MELFDASEGAKAVENVLDRATMEALYDLADDGRFDVLRGFVKDGKESKVAVAEAGDKLLAVKLYVVEASNYGDMRQYLDGDPRFEGVKDDRRSVGEAWCLKEAKNLQVAREAGVTAPRPVATEGNVLLMEFVGGDYAPAPQLQEQPLENPEYALDALLDDVATLWDAGLVHADLSAFNVLVWDGQLWLIDFSHAVETRHPRAAEFLRQDVEHLVAFFDRRYDVTRDADDAVAEITA